MNCPFCGHGPQVITKRGDWGYTPDMYAFGCANKGCAVQPRTCYAEAERWDDKTRRYVPVDWQPKAEYAWNDRA